LFRKAKAQGELGFIEKAEETLLEAKKVSSPAGEDVHSYHEILSC